MAVFRRLALLFVLVPPSLIGVVGCSDDSKKTGTVVKPDDSVKQAEKNMEDFMNTQGKNAANK